MWQLPRDTDWQTGPASTGTPIDWDPTRKRQRNARVALERIIEKAGEVDVTTSAVVQAYATVNVAGGWIDRTEKGEEPNRLM